MTMQLRDLLRGVFIGTTGRISLSDQDGSTFSSDDFDALTAWCVQADDPWIDLVTKSGECVGIYVAGDHKAVEPQPSCAVPDGMIYLLDDVVPNMEQGPNVVPVDTLFDALDEEETPILFDPKTLD